MSKKPTSEQVDAWRAMNLACGSLARAIYHTAKAEGLSPRELGASDVLRELYDACDSVRDNWETKHPGLPENAPW